MIITYNGYSEILKSIYYNLLDSLKLNFKISSNEKKKRMVTVLESNSKKKISLKKISSYNILVFP